MSGKGKIARLPYQVRQELNVRLQDGQQPADVLAWLNALPEARAALKGKKFGGGKSARPAITEQNLSEYRRPGGPFEEWAANQDRVEAVKRLSEFACRLAEATGGDLNAAAVQICGGKILEAIETSEDGDRVAIADALARLNKSEADKLNARTRQAALPLLAQRTALEQEKFQRQTAELFLKWYSDKRAREIAEGKGTADHKIAEIRQLMYGTVTNDA
jgi:hypothetical protein